MAGVKPMSEDYAAAHEFFLWAVKWFFKEKLLFEHASTPDCREVINFIETIGYDLKRFEELPELENNRAELPESMTTYDIKITWPKLRKHAVFTSKVVNTEMDIANKETSSLITEGKKPAFPPISLGMKLVTKEFLSYLMHRLNNDSSDSSGVSTKSEIPAQLEGGINKHSMPEAKKPEHHRSLESMLPDTKFKMTDVLNKLSLEDIKKPPQNDVQMDVDDIVSSMGGSNEALSSRPASPLLGGNAKMLLVREKTWSLGNINDLNDPLTAPQHTSSPLDNSDCQETNEELLNPLNEIANKLQELLVNVKNNKWVKSARPTLIQPSPSGSKEQARHIKRASLRRSSLTDNTSFTELQRSNSMKRLRPDTEKASRSPKVTVRTIPRSIVSRQTPTTLKPQTSEGRTSSSPNIPNSRSPRTPSVVKTNPGCAAVAEYRSRILTPLRRSCSIPRLPSSGVNLNAVSSIPSGQTNSLKKIKSSILKPSPSTSGKSTKEVGKTPLSGLRKPQTFINRLIK